MTRRGWAGALAGRRPAPAGVVARGLVAGLAGTAAMAAYQTAVLKARGAEPSSTPGEVGRRIVEGVLERRVPEERMGLLNNGMHLAYGSSWGAPLARRSPRAGRG